MNQDQDPLHGENLEELRREEMRLELRLEAIMLQARLEGESPESVIRLIAEKEKLQEELNALKI